MQGKGLKRIDDGSDSVMAVGMDLFATTFAVFFILAIISWSFQGGDLVNLEKVTTITRIEGDCGFNIVTSLDMISDNIKNDYCYSNGDCMDNPEAQSSVVSPTNINQGSGTSLFIADFKIPFDTKELIVDSNSYFAPEETCIHNVGDVEMIVLFRGNEVIVSKSVAEFINNGISRSIQLENYK